jgi:hypothetical protein
MNPANAALTQYPGVVYQGDLTIQEVPGTTIRTNEFDLAVMVRKFRGHRDYLNSFLNAHPKYSADAAYPTMNATEYFITLTEGCLVELDMTYKGILLGSAPTVIVSNDSKLAATKVTTDDPSDGSVSLQYYANVTIYRYILATFQNYPAYNSPRATALDYQIVSQDPAPGALKGNLDYSTQNIFTRFNCEQQGLWFTYEVQIERQIVPNDSESVAQGD